MASLFMVANEDRKIYHPLHQGEVIMIQPFNLKAIVFLFCLGIMNFFPGDIQQILPSAISIPTQILESQTNSPLLHTTEGCIRPRIVNRHHPGKLIGYFFSENGTHGNTKSLLDLQRGIIQPTQYGNIVPSHDGKFIAYRAKKASQPEKIYIENMKQEIVAELQWYWPEGAMYRWLKSGFLEIKENYGDYPAFTYINPFTKQYKRMAPIQNAENFEPYVRAMWESGSLVEYSPSLDRVIYSDYGVLILEDTENHSIIAKIFSSNPPIWASDGTRFAVSIPTITDPMWDRFQVFMVTRDGHQTQLTDYSEQTVIEEFTISPDGRYLTVSTFQRENENPSNGEEDISEGIEKLEIIDLNNPNVPVLCYEGKYAVYANWAPDSNYLAFLSYISGYPGERAEGGCDSLVVMDVEEKKIIRSDCEPYRATGWIIPDDQ